MGIEKKRERVRLNPEWRCNERESLYILYLYGLDSLVTTLENIVYDLLLLFFDNDYSIKKKPYASLLDK